MGVRSSYVLVTPVHQDAGQLDDLVVTIRQQERRPDRWVIVDDASTDGTAARLRRLSDREPWIHGATLPEARAPRRRSELLAVGLRLAVARVAAERAMLAELHAQLLANTVWALAKMEMKEVGSGFNSAA